MGSPTVTQRVEQIEEKFTHLEEAVSEMVTKAVERAMEAMHRSLSDMIIEGQTKAAKQLGDDLDALAGRLEGRVQRTRQFHEVLINSMKDEQVKFQFEIRSTMTGMNASQGPVMKKPHGSVNQAGVSPNPMATLLGNEGFANGVGGSGTQGDGCSYGGFGGYGGSGPGGIGLGVNGVLMSGGVGGTGGTGTGGWRYRKLDMPLFEGNDPDG